jgi:hypothetical protein
MTKRFVIGTANLTSEQEDELLSYIRSNKVAWWHWFPNFWLIKDSSGILTASGLRDAVRNADCLVMEIDGDITWATHGGKNSAGNSMTNWLKKTWAN